MAQALPKNALNCHSYCGCFFHFLGVAGLCLSTSILQQVAQAIALDGEAAWSYSIIGCQELLRALPHWLYARQHALSITRRRRSIDAQCIGVPSRMGTLAPCGRTSWPAMSHSCPNHVPNHVPNPCPKLVSMGLCKIARDSKENN